MCRGDLCVSVETPRHIHRPLSLKGYDGTLDRKGDAGHLAISASTEGDQPSYLRSDALEHRGKRYKVVVCELAPEACQTQVQLVPFQSDHSRSIAGMDVIAGIAA